MTLLARFDASVDGASLDVSVNVQVEHLGTVLTLVERLATNPPTQVADLQNVLGSIPISDINVPADLAARIAGLSAAVPSDPSAVVAPLLGQLESLGTEFGGALALQLRQVLQVIERVHALTQIDFRCLDSGGNGTGGGIGAGAGGGGAGGGGGGGGGAGGDGGGGGGGGGGGVGGVGGEEADTQPSATRGAVATANAALDGLPEPLDVRSLLVWLHARTGLPRRLLPAVIPLLDDIRDPVETLLEWEALSPVDIRAHMVTSIGDADVFLRGLVDRATTDVFADASTLAGAVPAADLARIATDLATALGALRTAAEGASASAAGAAAADINALLDELDSLRPGLMGGPLVDAGEIGRRIRLMPMELEEGIAHAIGMLRPGGSLLERLPQGVEAPVIADLERWLTDVGDWLQDVADALDVEAIREPLAETANAARAVADGLEQGVAALTIAVGGLFDELVRLLDQIDVGAAKAQLEQAIDRARDELLDRIEQAIGPARDALQQAIDAIDGAIDQFDPQQVVSALEAAVDAVAGVFDDPAVTGAINQIRAVLEQATAAIESLSFAPVTDQVIGVIDELTAALRAIEPAVLPPPATAALNAAVLALPSSLQPVTNPIVVDFGGLVESGPVQLLERIREQPARVLDQVRRLEPAALIGEALSTPFQAVLREADRVRPSRVLEPVRSEFDAMKTALRRSARPSQAVAPLQAPFAQVQTALEALDPAAITTPLNEALDDAVANVMDVLPVDETFAAIDTVLDSVRHVIETADEVTALVRRLQLTFATLSDAPEQLELWIDSVLDRVEQIPDTAPLVAPLAALRDTVDSLRAAGIRQHLSDGLQTLRAACDDVAGGDRLAAIVVAHRAVPRAALEALLPGAERTAALAALDRFDPLAPSFGAPYHALAGLGRAMDDATAALEERLDGWDARYHEAGGALDDLRRDQPTPAQLRSWAEQILDAQIVRPLNRLFGVIAPTAALLDVLLLRFEAILADLRGKLDDLLLGPDALGGIRDAIGAIFSQILDFDLDFLTESLQTVFDEVRGKLDAVSPAQLGEALDARFDQVLDALSLDAILPPAQVAQLDNAYRTAIDRLRGLDPGPIVVAAVQPLWDARVPPLIDALDVTVVLDALIAKLRELDGELRVELGRVDDSYRAMLAAVPPFELSLDISIDVGF